MKKTGIILLAACALLSFSCNKYCHCKYYLDGKEDKSLKDNFVYESGSCSDYDSPLMEKEGHTYETKCK